MVRGVTRRMWMAALIAAVLSLGVAACGEEAEPTIEASAAAGDPLEASRIRELAARVADWQLEHPEYESTDWTNAVFYSGLLAAHRITGEPRYLAVPLEVGRRSGWRPGARIRHADDHAIAQTYLELFRLEAQPSRIEPFRIAIDRMMREPPDWTKPHQTVDYWWCDALFMSPPALAQLAEATGEASYLDFMDRLWRESYDLLFDRQQRLFHRDLRSREAGGRFWARGNGWVLAGLARLLEVHPRERPSRVFYEGVFRDLAARVVDLQREDGLWRSDLLSEQDSEPGESSASALLCFALAWGVEHGLLDREASYPAVAAAWTGLARNVSDTGRLGWVQRPGAGPGRASPRHAEVYGSGAFLLAAEQVLALQGGSTR